MFSLIGEYLMNILRWQASGCLVYSPSTTRHPSCVEALDTVQLGKSSMSVMD